MTTRLRLRLVSALATGSVILALTLSQAVASSSIDEGATTVAADQIELLRTIYSSTSVLSEPARAYVDELMSTVDDDQRFGPSAVDSEAALKVGYLQRSTTGLWDVTVVGKADVEGRTLLIAVLSADNITYESGVDLVDTVTSLASAAWG